MSPLMWSRRFRTFSDQLKVFLTSFGNFFTILEKVYLFRFLLMVGGGDFDENTESTLGSKLW